MSDEKYAADLINQIHEICAVGCLNIIKFISNEKILLTILKNIPDMHRRELNLTKVPT